MATIKEDYISFETAKLLKEKGFNVSEIDAYFPFVYYSDGKMDFYDDDKPLFVCEAVTHQMAIKWLREVHNIVIVIEPHMYDYINEKNSSYVASLWQGDNYYENITSKDYPTYEEACEVACIYALKNLI